MLVLTRKNGETVCINQRIEVKVLSISRNTVKLGFSAPPQVNIRRQELRSGGQTSRLVAKRKAFARSRRLSFPGVLLTTAHPWQGRNRTDCVAPGV